MSKKTFPTPKTQAGDPKSSPFKAGAKSTSAPQNPPGAKYSYTPYTPATGSVAELKSKFAGGKKPAPGPSTDPKNIGATGKSSVSYLRSIFEKGVLNSFSFSPSSYAQGVKRLNHYDATGNLIQQFKGVSIMDRLRKRKARATDLSAMSAADQVEAELAYDLDAGIELDQGTFDDFFAQQQTQVNPDTKQQNTPTQAVHDVFAKSLPSAVLTSDVAAITASAGTAAAQNVAALWRAENKVRDLTEKLNTQVKEGAPAQEIGRTKQELKVAEAEVERLRAVVQADERSQSSQAEQRRAHRAELARAEKLLRQARERLVTLEKPGSGASQSEIEAARANVAKLEAEVERLRAIVVADDAAQNSPRRAELARAEAIARAARERLVLLEKPGSGATAQQIADARAAVKAADAEVARLQKIVAEDEAAQNSRNALRTQHRADLAQAEFIAQQAHERLAILEEPNSGASEAELAKARAAAASADAEVTRRRAIVQKDDEEYAAYTASKDAVEAAQFTALTVNQLSLMEQGVLKVSDMLEKGETDVGKVFDDGVAELVLKTLLLANNGFAAAVERISRNKTPTGGSTLSPAELTSAEENFIANAYVINACLFIVNAFSLSTDTRHRQLLIEGYNAISIVLTSLSLAPLSSPTVVTLPDDVTEEKETDIINPSFALSDLFNISVGSLNEDEEENDQREADGEDAQIEKKENRMKPFFVSEENDNIRKLFGFVLNLKSGGTVDLTSSGTTATQDTENKLLALRILFTIYKSSPLPSILTVPSSPVYSGPYAGVFRQLLQTMNEYIGAKWNPQKTEETAEKRKEVMTSIVQLLLAILYVLEGNHNLRLFVEEGYTKTLAGICGSSPSQVLLPDSDEEERKTYALLISTSITVIDKIYVVPFKSPEAATSSDLAFLRSPETASFLLSTIVPILTRTISECLPASANAVAAAAADATTLPYGALFSNEDQNGLRDEAIACIAAFQKNNILTAATLPTTGVVAAYAGWIKAGAEQLSQWTVEGDGDEADCNSYSLHIHILCTFLNNLLVAFKLGTHVAECGTLEAFFALIHNKYISLQKNNATLLASTYPKIGAILNTFLVNLAVVGANSAPPGKENIFLQYFLKNNAPQYLSPFIECASFKTAFTPAQQFGFVRATFFFFKDYVLDPAIIKAPLQFLRTFLSNAQAPVEDVKVALRCLVLVANKKENLPTLKSGNLAPALENFTSSSTPEVAKLSTQLRNILK